MARHPLEIAPGCGRLTEAWQNQTRERQFLLVAIPSLDRPSAVSLAEKLSVEARTLEGVAVSIYNNGATRSIAEAAMRLPDVAFEHDDAAGLSRARNRALRASDAVYVLFLDDDIIPPAGFLKRVVATLREFSPDILGAPIEPVFDCEPSAWLPLEYVTRRKAQQSGWVARGAVSGGNFAVRRVLALAIGGFREDLGMAGRRMAFLEELEFVLRYRASPKRTGAGIYYALDCAVGHPMPREATTLQYLARRAWRSHFEKGRLFVGLARPERRNAYRLATLAALITTIGGAVLAAPAASVRDGFGKTCARYRLASIGAIGLTLGAMRAGGKPAFSPPEKILRQGADFKHAPGPEFDTWAFHVVRFRGRPSLRILLRLLLDSPATAIEVAEPSPGDVVFRALGFVSRAGDTPPAGRSPA